MSARTQTRLMAQEKGESAVRYRGLLDALVRIPREEGVAALWRGLLPRLMRIPPGQARPLALGFQALVPTLKTLDSGDLIFSAHLTSQTCIVCSPHACAPANAAARRVVAGHVPRAPNA